MINTLEEALGYIISFGGIIQSYASFIDILI